MYDPLLEVVLHQPEIPHNAGAVGRACVAVGARLWLVRPLGFRVDNRYLKRAGLDYWPHLSWEVVDDWSALTQRLADRRFWFFTKKASQGYDDVSYTRGDVFVFGSESQGLPEALWQARPDAALRIPIRPDARSLNLSVSVGIATFEARRQIIVGNMNQ